VVTREELEQQARAFLALQREHLRLEEDRLIPRLEELLDPAVLDAAAALLPGDDDPAFGAQGRDQFVRLFERLQEAGGDPPSSS
jgi:hemerythrin-like domain-containing protein